MSRLPDFLIVGASRSGTSTLHSVLSAHPAVAMPHEKKEIQFFSDDRNFARGLSWYQNRFNVQPATRVVGEASPPYFHRGIRRGLHGEHVWDPDNDAAARAYAALPDARIVMSLRNPVDRLQSQFWKNVWQGHETETSLVKAVEQEIRGERQPQETPHCWLYKNSYSVHIARWVELFGRDRVFVLIFEEWTANPQSKLSALQEFLGLPAGQHQALPRLKKNNGGRQLKPGYRPLSRLGRNIPAVQSFIRRYGTVPGYPDEAAAALPLLHDYFRDDLRRAAGLLGINLDIWEQ